MNIGPAFIADYQPPEATQPGQSTFDHPAMTAELLAGVDTTPSNPWEDVALPTGRATKRMIIALVRMQLARTATGTARLATHRWDRIEHVRQEQAIVAVGRREPYGEWNASGVDHKVALRARFAAIRRIRPGLFAPFLAAMLALSSEARDQSSLSAPCKRASNSWWRRSQTPAACQSRSRRQQVIPLPQPSSCGSISQGMPLFKTKMIPVSAARSLTRGRPPLGLGGSAGSSGAITAHNSSLTSGLFMPPVYHRFC